MAGTSEYGQSPRRPFITYRADANQPEIVKTFRKLGYSVKHSHSIGQGFPDIIVGKFDLTWIIEIKDGHKPPSARQFTDRQREFNFEWRGNRCVITSCEEVIAFDNQVRVLIDKMKGSDINWVVTGSQEAIYKISLY